MRAGLGGGSADAAATLVALNRLWDAHVDPHALVEIAASLGSDVPFFLTGGTALGTGRGEMVEALPDVPPRWVVLVQPPVGVSTAEAYGWYDADWHGGQEASRTDPPAATWSGSIVNDLEAPVARRHPEIDAAKQALLASAALTAGMTGSGSTVAGLYGTRAAAGGAARALRADGWQVIVTRTLTRAEFQRRARPRLSRRATERAGG
jgi:4-diphosphocytidyl-2-C-methyl-D-erythritol kinase